MGDEAVLVFLRLFVNKSLEILQVMQHRQVVFQALLRRREHDLLQPVHTDLLALGEAAEQHRDLVRTYLRTFLYQPLHPLDILRRRNGYMQMKIMQRLLLLAADNLKIAMLGMRIRDPRRIGCTLAVGNENLIARAVP